MKVEVCKHSVDNAYLSARIAVTIVTLLHSHQKQPLVLGSRRKDAFCLLIFLLPGGEKTGQSFVYQCYQQYQVFCGDQFVSVCTGRICVLHSGNVKESADGCAHIKHSCQREAEMFVCCSQHVSLIEVQILISRKRRDLHTTSYYLVLSFNDEGYNQKKIL